MASTKRYPLLSLREFERDGDMLKETLPFSLTRLVNSATYLLILLRRGVLVKRAYLQVVCNIE